MPEFGILVAPETLREELRKVEEAARGPRYSHALPWVASALGLVAPIVRSLTAGETGWGIAYILVASTFAVVSVAFGLLAWQHRERRRVTVDSIVEGLVRGDGPGA